ncbi:hypothetical protein [Faecalimonas umbilicata]|nr:hypothetical protein [Faecalimonas umbilicata]
MKGGKEDETLSEPDTDFRFQLDGNHEKTYAASFFVAKNQKGGKRR